MSSETNIVKLWFAVSNLGGSLPAFIDISNEDGSASSLASPAGHVNSQDLLSATQVIELHEAVDNEELEENPDPRTGNKRPKRRMKS